MSMNELNNSTRSSSGFAVTIHDCIEGFRNTKPLCGWCVFTFPMDQQLIRVLHVSDSHCCWSLLERVATLASSGAYDCIIHTGDLGNYNHTNSNSNDTSISIMEAEADAHKVLLTLEKGHELPVYFIAGNHDPSSLMTATPRTKVGSRSRNVHGEACVALAPGLSVCGLGGAVPGVQGGYIVWEGYPYTEQQVRLKFNGVVQVSFD
jgi:Icc-related predicted phosphoesterase